MDAVNLGSVFGGPAGRGWGFGGFHRRLPLLFLLVRRGSFFAFGVCEFTVLDFGVGIGFVVVGEGVLIVFGYAGLDLTVGPRLSFWCLGWAHLLWGGDRIWWTLRRDERELWLGRLGGGAKAMIIPVLFLSQRTLLPTCCGLPHGYFTGGQDGLLTCGIEFGLPVAKSCKSSCRCAKVSVLDVFAVGLGPS